MSARNRIFEIAEESPQPTFESKMTISAVIALRKSITKCVRGVSV